MDLNILSDSSEAATRGVLKIFTKFTGKHLCQGLLFNKVAGLGLQPFDTFFDRAAPGDCF